MNRRNNKTRIRTNNNNNNNKSEAYANNMPYLSNNGGLERLLDEPDKTSHAKSNNTNRVDYEAESKSSNILSGLSISKLVASSLAAVAASVITSHLTGYVNSFLIVGGTVILVAILNEIISRCLKSAKHKAIRVATKIPNTQVRNVAIKMFDNSNYSKQEANETNVLDKKQANITRIISSENNYVNNKSNSSNITRKRYNFNLSFRTKMFLVMFVTVCVSCGVNWLMVKTLGNNRIVKNDGIKIVKTVETRPDNAIKTIINNQNVEISRLNNMLANLSDRVKALENQQKLTPNTNNNANNSTISNPNNDKITNSGANNANVPHDNKTDANSNNNGSPKDNNITSSDSFNEIIERLKQHKDDNKDNNKMSLKESKN